MNHTEPIRDKEDVRQLIYHYRKLGQSRNYALITLNVHTALRISDILRINCNDVYDFANKSVRESITLTEKKTGKAKTIALNEDIVKALEYHFPNAKPNTALILNEKTQEAIGRIQAYRLIRNAGEAIELYQRVSSHSLRKTFGYHAWKKGASPAVIMEIYNHSSFEVTRRYLGIAQDDKNAVYLGINFTA